MQKGQLAKNIGYRVRLRPIACRLDMIGQELPQMDDDWIVMSVADDGVVVANVRTQHQFTLGYDHVHHFTSDTTRREGDAKFGFLVLLVQIYLQGANLTIEPTLKPGERVPPTPVKILDRAVDFNFPADSGLKTIFEAQGLRMSWARESRLARLEFEGWKRVIMRTDDGSYVQYRVKDVSEDQVLVWRPNR